MNNEGKRKANGKAPVYVVTTDDGSDTESTSCKRIPCACNVPKKGSLYPLPRLTTSNHTEAIRRCSGTLTITKVYVSDTTQ